MRRTLFVVAGVALAAVAARVAHKRRAPQAELEPGSPDPADELRRTLDATREGEEPSLDAPRPSLEERRTRVHEKAQEAIDLMDEPGAS